jgi:hypothetical protein
MLRWHERVFKFWVVYKTFKTINSFIANNRLDHVNHLAATYEKSRDLIQDWLATQPENGVATFGPDEETAEPEYEPEPSLLEDSGPAQLSLDDCQGVIWCTGFQSSVQSYLKLPPQALP